VGPRNELLVACEHRGDGIHVMQKWNLALIKCPVLAHFPEYASRRLRTQLGGGGLFTKKYML